MSSVEKSIVVDVPVSTAYNQWTQFEEFPRFMEGVEEVRQLDDKRLHWRANIGGKQEEWDAEIVDQVPDQRIAWRSTSGSQNDGVVTFRSAGGNSTEVMLHLDYDPEGVLENLGNLLGVVSRRVEGDLERFKEFIESRGGETGAWRGEIHGQQVEGSGSGSVGMSGSTMGSGSATTTGASYGSTGSGYSTSTTGTSSMGATGSTSAGSEEVAVPVVEEQLSVGKREVESGGVRVNVEVEETPVQEQVTLREERVDVERRPVNRPASDADFQSVPTGTVEVRERAEEAVVQKEARVVEEVVINKEVEQRTETIQDTVRRTDVDVEQTPGSTTSSGTMGTSSTGGVAGAGTSDTNQRSGGGGTNY